MIHYELAPASALCFAKDLYSFCFWKSPYETKVCPTSVNIHNDKIDQIDGLKKKRNDSDGNMEFYYGF
jgi:hypothetical protein